MCLGFIFGLVIATLWGRGNGAQAGVSAKAHLQSAGTAQVRVSPSGKARVRPLAGPELGGAEAAFLALLELEPGAGVPEHRDSTEEFVHFLEGHGTLHVDGRSFDVQPGDTVYMPANALVRFEGGDAPMKVLQVFAPPGPEAKYEGWPLADSD
jgi:quercetin dioxygenase-like cupin family protein